MTDNEFNKQSAISITSMSRVKLELFAAKAQSALLFEQKRIVNLHKRLVEANKELTERDATIKELETRIKDKAHLSSAIAFKNLEIVNLEAELKKEKSLHWLDNYEQEHAHIDIKNLQQAVHDKQTKISDYQLHAKEMQDQIDSLTKAAAAKTCFRSKKKLLLISLTVDSLREQVDDL